MNCNKFSFRNQNPANQGKHTTSDSRGNLELVLIMNLKISCLMRKETLTCPSQQTWLVIKSRKHPKNITNYQIF